MSAYASITLSIDLTRRRGAPFSALRIVEECAGTRNVAVDAAAGTVTFELQFPGNLSALVERLRADLIPVAERATFAIGVVPRGGGIVDPAETSHRVTEGNEVWDAQFRRAQYVLDAHVEGDRLSATVLPGTNAMHEIYDALMTLNVVPLDVPSPPAIAV